MKTVTRFPKLQHTSMPVMAAALLVCACGSSHGPSSSPGTGGTHGSGGSGASGADAARLADCKDACEAYYDCEHNLCLLHGGSTCATDHARGLETCEKLTTSDCTATLLADYEKCETGGGTGGTGGSGSESCAATCDGCCTAAGACEKGSEPWNCGTDGSTCKDCSEACLDGECVTQRSACEATCDGCCGPFGQCESGTSTSSCGASGDACKACSRTTQECQSGACVTVPTCGDRECNGDETCSSCSKDCGKCVVCVDGTSRCWGDAGKEDCVDGQWENASYCYNLCHAVRAGCPGSQACNTSLGCEDRGDQADCQCRQFCSQRGAFMCDSKNAMYAYYCSDDSGPRVWNWLDCTAVCTDAGYRGSYGCESVQGQAKCMCY